MKTEASSHGWVRATARLGLLLAAFAAPRFAASEPGLPGGDSGFSATARRPIPDALAQAEEAAAEPAADASAPDPLVPDRIVPDAVVPDAIVPGEGASTSGEVEEVVVTGSRIQRDNYGGLGPISTLSQEDITRRGVFAIGDLVRELPSVGLNGLTATDTNGGRGLQTIDLRDLGAQRTLILVNGRRFVQSSTGASEAVDLNNLPPSLIQRVEVLRDGVSTIYGADAVAGVVNFILRDDFEGLELNLSGGSSQRGDSEKGDVSLTWGKNFSRGNVTLSGSLSSFSPLRITDRGFSRSPIRSAEFNSDGDLVIMRDFFRARSGRVQSSDNMALNNLFFDPSGMKDVSTGFDGRRNGAKINNQFFLTGEQVRSSLNGLFSYDVTDAIKFFSELTYTRRNGEQRFSEAFLDGTPSAKNMNGFTIPLFRSGDPRNSPFVPADLVDRAFLDMDGNPLPDSTQSVNVTINRSLSEFGPRIFENDSRTVRFAAGFRGELPELLGGFNWELFGNYGRNQDEELTKNELNLSRALRSAQPELCAQDPRCVVGDFFGDRSLFATPGALRFIKFKSKDELQFDLREAGASLSGSVIDLPAGELKAAVGAEYREESGSARPDPLRISGDVGGNARSATRGGQIIREAFFETQVPLVRGVRGVDELTLELSGRYTDYSSFGGRYLSRYAFSYAPVDVVRLRGVYATSFRSPGISDLFLGSADSFVPARDRCEGFPNVMAGSAEQTARLRAQCAAQLPQGRFSEANPFTQRGGVGSQIRANVGGSPDVKEETATTMNFGLVVTPPWLADLELSLDYYDIDIQDPIVGQSAQDRIDDCLIDADATDCAAIKRDNDGVLTFVDTRRTNFGSIRTNGYDFGARYRFRLPVVGEVGVDFEGNYIVDFKVDSGMTDTQNGLVGTPNFKGRLATVINPLDRWELQATARYFGRVEDEGRKELGLPLNSAPGVTYLDLSTSYAFGSENKYNLTFGLNNAMDRQPPRLVDGLTNTSAGNYDVIGRSFFASFRSRF